MALVPISPATSDEEARVFIGVPSRIVMDCTDDLSGAIVDGSGEAPVAGRSERPRVVLKVFLFLLALCVTPACSTTPEPRSHSSIAPTLWPAWQTGRAFLLAAPGEAALGERFRDAGHQTPSKAYRGDHPFRAL
jgi:hypothetical protein